MVAPIYSSLKSMAHDAPIESSDSGDSGGAAPVALGGQGLLPVSDGHHDRADARLAIRAILNGWPIPDEMRATIPAVAGRMAVDENLPTRDRVRAMELLIRIDQMRLAAATEVDKLSRLDDGKPTDNVGIVQVSVV